MQEANEGANPALSFYDVQLDQNDIWQVARVETTAQGRQQLMLLHPPKKADEVRTTSTQLLYLDGKGYRKAPFRSHTCGIPSPVRSGLARIPATIAILQNIINALAAYRPGQQPPELVLDLLRGRHPLTLESVMMTEYPSSELQRTIREYLIASIRFFGEYLSSLKMEEYYSVAFSVDDKQSTTQSFAARFGNPYASSLAAHESAYPELLESFNTAINTRNNVKFYCLYGRAPNQQRVVELRRHLIPALTDTFLPGVTTNLNCMIDNPQSMCPLWLVYRLLTLSEAICEKHYSPLLVGQLTAFVIALLKLHRKTMEQLEKLPNDRLRMYFEEKWVPESLGRLLGDKIKHMVAEAQLKYIPLYTKMGKEGLERLSQRLTKLAEHPDYEGKFAAMLQNQPILDFVLTFKDSPETHMVLKIIKDLSVVFSGNTALLERIVLTLLESANPSAGHALADVLTKAPKDVRDRTLSDLETGKADEQQSCKFLRFAVRLGENISDKDNVRRCAFIALRYLRNCEEFMAPELAGMLDKHPDIAQEIMKHCFQFLGTDLQNEPSYNLIARQFELLKEILSVEDLTSLKSKIFDSMKYNLDKNLDRLKRRLAFLSKICNLKDAGQNQVVPLTHLEVMQLIDIFKRMGAETSRNLMISKFFLKEEDNGHPSSSLNEEAKRSLIAALEDIGLKDFRKFELYISLFLSLNLSSDALSYTESEPAAHSLCFLIDSLLKTEDVQLSRKAADKICKLYLHVEERDSDKAYRQLFEKVLTSTGEVGYYLLGLLNDAFSMPPPAVDKTPVKVAPAGKQVSTDRKTAVLDDADTNRPNQAQAETVHAPHTANAINTVIAHAQQALTEGSSHDSLPVDSRNKHFDSLVQEFFLSIFDQLPRSWELVNKRDPQNTPIADQLVSANSKEEWRQLFDGHFKRRFYLLRTIDALQLSVEWLKATGAMEVFEDYIEKEDMYGEKFEYNAALLRILEQSYQGTQPKGSINLRLLREINNLLVMVFQLPADWLRCIDKSAVNRMVDVAFTLMTCLTSDPIHVYLEEGRFVPLISAACLIDLSYLTELVVENKLFHLVDRSEKWAEALNTLLNQPFLPDNWRIERELLSFVAIFLRKSNSLKQHYEYAEELFMRSLSIVVDPSLPDHINYGYLCIMRSLFNCYDHFVLQLPVEMINVFSGLLHHRDRDVVSIAHELMPIIWERKDFREQHAVFLASTISDGLMHLTRVKDEIGHQPHRSTFVGLDNPRCICYMNSFLQQLYNIPEFGEALLRSNWQPPTNSREDLIGEMKRCYLTLRDSQTDSFNNEGFYAGAYKNIDGSPVNLSQQMDADEFGKHLFDQMEKQLPKDGNFVSQFFQGQLQTNIVSEECPHRSSRSEDFVSLELNIHEQNLERALEELTRPETLQGDNAYSCDECKRKVRANKFIKLKRLPNVLICVLKRFEYNREQATRQKLNNRFEFPMETFKVSAELCPDEQPQYRLRGVVIHGGTSEYGHYYSFIRCRQIWYIFDDSRVERTDSSVVWHRSLGVEHGYQSAYLLFYEKVEANYGSLSQQSQELYPQPQIIDGFRQQIRTGNLYQYNFSKELSDFVDACLQREYKNAPEIKVFVWLYLFNVRIYTSESVEPLFNYLKEGGVPLVMLPSLLSNKLFEGVLSLQLDNCAQTKHYCLNLLVWYIRQLDIQHQCLYANQGVFLSYYPFSNYAYLFLAQLANNNPQIVTHLLQKKMIGRIMDVFMSSTGFAPDQNDFTDKMRCMDDVGARNIDNILLKLIIYDKGVPRYRWVLLDMLLKASPRLNAEESNRLGERSKPYFKEVFAEALDKISLNSICSYLRRMSEDTAFSDNLMNAIEKDLKQLSIQSLRPYFRVMLMLCSIDDAHAPVRIKASFKIMLDLINVGYDRSNWFAGREPQRIEEYRGERRLLLELAVQWMMRILRNVQQSIDIFRELPYRQQFKFLENIKCRPYINRATLANCQLNGLTRNMVHGIMIPTGTIQHERLYRDIRSFFGKIAYMTYPDFTSDSDLDGDLFLKDINLARPMRYLKQTPVRGIDMMFCKLNRVCGETIYVRLDNKREEKEHTYEEFVAYLPVEQEEEYESPYDSASTQRLSDGTGAEP